MKALKCITIGAMYAHNVYTLSWVCMYYKQMKNLFDLKEGIWYKKERDKTGMDGRMDGCCHGDKNPINQHAQALFKVIETIRHVPVD